MIRVLDTTTRTLRKFDIDRFATQYMQIKNGVLTKTINGTQVVEHGKNTIVVNPGGWDATRRNRGEGEGGARLKEQKTTRSTVATVHLVRTVFRCSC